MRSEKEKAIESEEREENSEQNLACEFTEMWGADVSEAVKGDGDVDTWMGHYRGRLGPAPSLGVFCTFGEFVLFL